MFFLDKPYGKLNASARGLKSPSLINFRDNGTINDRRLTQITSKKRLCFIGKVKKEGKTWFGVCEENLQDLKLIIVGFRLFKTH